MMMMMMMMMRTMMLMCFMRAGIPSVTVGSTTDLMLLCLRYRMFFAFLFQELVWHDVHS